ncbi:response regulator [bacterium]|nr:response regulator [bacterium]NUN46860.1 response regulator [bacterium]
MRFTFSFVVLWFAVIVSAQDIPPRITIYNPSGAHPQSFDITQDSSGIIYVINYNGVFTFDGARWKKINGLLNEIDINQIKIDERTGKLFYGGFQQLGYADFERGQPRVVSLKPLVPAHTPVDLNRDVLIRGDEVIFIDRNAIFRYHGDSITSRRPKQFFGTGNISQNRIFVNYFGDTDQGIAEVIGDSLVPLPYFKNVPRVYSVLISGENKIVASTTYGISVWVNGEERLVYPAKDVRSGIHLSDGGYVFRTRSEGVIFFDSTLTQFNIINEDNGLSVNSTRNVMEDREGNVWVVTEDGINKIDRSPLSVLQKQHGIKGCVYAIAQTGRNFYIGTLNDLYRIENGKVIPQNFGRINGGVTVGDKHYFASGRGLLSIEKNGQYKLIANTPDATSIAVLDERFLVLGKRVGLSLYDQFENRETPIPNTDDIAGVAQLRSDRKGFLWVESDYGRVYKVDLKNMKTHAFDEAWRMVLSADSMIFMKRHDSLFRYDYRINELVVSTSFFPDTTNIIKALQDNIGTIWLFTSSAVWNGHREGVSWRWDNHRYWRIHNHTQQFAPNEVYRDQQGYVWFLTDDGILRMDLSRIVRSQTFHTVISRFSIGHDSSLIINDRRFEPIILPYAFNSVRIEYGATSYFDETMTRYQTWLEGFESEPGDWSVEALRVYSNLSEGDYVFHVKAINAQHVTQSTMLRFTILPPWFRTWWAWLLYGTIFMAMVTGIVRWRYFQIMREKGRLERIVEERTHLLSVQTQKLEALDAQKSRFFANISHEFRTPLTLIQGPLESMKEKPADEITIESMLRNTRRLLRLVNQLLDLSKIEHRQMKLRAYRGNWDFIKPVVFSFESLADKKKLSLTLDLTPDLPIMYRDRDVIEKILFNLLSNAIKFTNEGGVSVKVYANEGALTIDVEDTGIGISETDLVLIFDRFYQADHSGTRAYPGTGIGLALAKELAHLHHGSLTARSRQGEGTVFSFTIPIIEQSIPDDERTESETHSQESAPEWDDVAGPIQSTTAADTDADKNTLLIVEDNDEIRQYIRGIVSNDYRVIEAADGEDGMAEALRRTPDIIISDVMMPRKDGITLSRELKSDRRTSHIPLILLTAKADTEDKIEGLETGADDYLVKPFNEKELRTRIANLIQSRKLLREKYAKEIFIKDQDFEGETPDDLFLKELTQLIQSNLSDPEFSVEAISARLAMSRSQVYRKLVALTDTTPSELIRKLRLRKAKSLLESQAGNVTQVAYDVGYTSLSHFTKAFRDEFGINPSDTI